MDVPFWVWTVTVAAIIGLLVFDFVGHVRTPHAPTLRESAVWSAVYVGIAVVFGLLVLWFAGPEYGGEYFAGFVTEKSLSVDNLFVFVLVMASFAVPRELQQKVLLFGIAFALVLRTVFIFVGAAAIENFSWVFYVFGGFLVWTAWAQARSGGHSHDEEFRENAVLRLTRRVLPTTEDYHSDRMVVKLRGKRYITPLAIALVAIASADILFAVDSIPAIFGLTQETYLVFTANAFALLGLRQLFFLIDGLLDRLVYLSYGLAVILGFIGVKLLIHALHTNELPFVNGGDHVTVIPEVPTWLSLTVILVTLAVTTVASLVKNRRDRARGIESSTGAGDPAADGGRLLAQGPGDRDPHAGSPDRTPTSPGDATVTGAEGPQGRSGGGGPAETGPDSGATRASRTDAAPRPR
ncbi:TerC family protein [Geodermatophilus sp. TF02-6]|uniref:TerC family protein n=1 Tax=Geodermatophilus sp. TF02-6 TaxID=2250575 RepID=UPI000DE9D096|nr:TerC family protein [Geodermatophilus sp. TF02-6]RBY83035.1 TerC family protein [Geodermatophilus sp. TF02-6]